MKLNTLTHGFYSRILGLSLGCNRALAGCEMVVVGYGGGGRKARNQAFSRPSSAADASTLIQSEDQAEMARIKVMVDTGKVEWDVVQIEGPDLLRGCAEGLYRPTDPGHGTSLRFRRTGLECGNCP